MALPHQPLMPAPPSSLQLRPLPRPILARVTTTSPLVELLDIHRTPRLPPTPPHPAADKNPRPWFPLLRPDAIEPFKFHFCTPPNHHIINLSHPPSRSSDRRPCTYHAILLDYLLRSIRLRLRTISYLQSSAIIKPSMSESAYKYKYQNKTGTTHQHIAPVGRLSGRSLPECPVIEVKLGAGVSHARTSPQIPRHTFGKSALSSNMASPQHSSRSNPTSLASFPWLKLSSIAALTSAAVFIR